MEARNLALELNCSDIERTMNAIENLALEAKENNLVIIYGTSFQKASPVKLRGAITDDLEDGYILLIPAGHEVELIDYDENEKWREGHKENPVAVQLSDDADGSTNPNMITADFNEEEVWGFTTQIPHNTFNIFDGDKLFCVGIVIDLGNLAIPEPVQDEKVFHVLAGGETFMICAENFLQVLKLYFEPLSVTEDSLDEVDDVVEIPEEDWDKYSIAFPDEVREDDEVPVTKTYRQILNETYTKRPYMMGDTIG